MLGSRERENGESFGGILAGKDYTDNKVARVAKHSALQKLGGTETPPAICRREEVVLAHKR